MSAGPVWESAGTTQTFYLTSEIEKAYIAKQSTKAVANVELFAGAQHFIMPNVSGQLGLAVAATSKATLSGVIWDDAEPQFDNYTYSYKIQHNYVALKSKLLADMGYWMTPWLSVSAGVGFNRASSFQNTPTIETAVVTPNFASHTKTAFTYTCRSGSAKGLK